MDQKEKDLNEMIAVGEQQYKEYLEVQKIAQQVNLHKYKKLSIDDEIRAKAREDYRTRDATFPIGLVFDEERASKLVIPFLFKK